MTIVPTVLNTTAQAGFSLLELLVASTILLLVTGGGIATMVRFNDRQQLREGAALMQDTLRAAQTRAKIGDVPESCHTAKEAVQRYDVILTANSPLVRVQVTCGTQTIETSSVTLPGNVTPEASDTVGFIPLYGGVVGDTEIVLQQAGMRYILAVTPQGEITTGELQ